MSNVDAGLKVKTKHAGGRPKGFDKLKQHMRLCAMVAASQDAMTEAQIKNAQGIKYLVTRDKASGKFTKLTEEEAKLRLAEGHTEMVEVWDERPNVQAFTDLMNRVLGKPAETVNADVKGDIAIKWQGE